MRKSIIALDADGVLLDYNLAYAGAWERAFGVRPQERDPLAYWAMDRWAVERLDGPRLQQLVECFDETFWSNVPAIETALPACHALHDAGYELVCVSAVEVQYAKARLRNLRALGFPIERVIATGDAADGRSPKADALIELQACAFVDDFLPYMAGLPASIHAALVQRSPNGTPNVGVALASVHSQHIDLADFAAWWLSSR
ncbi:HAD family hydrolase [Methylibium rhizosphaerae]|uniref:HAD family hydrolase n=1 Tax=Methylibium rhizosphaerae TaxID=2570323 RepID=UPI0011289AF4|nr:HAD family hydrolase [Methylibium rhizosphaerae]